MKNLAICFSGAIRSFHLCDESIIKHIVNPLKSRYNVYIFGHFWQMKQDQNISDLSYQMKWKKESNQVHEIIKNFGFTECVIEDYNTESEKTIMDRLGKWTTSEKSDSEFEKDVRLADKILEEYNKIEDPEKRLQYTNYAVNCMGMYYKIMLANKLKRDWSEKNNIKFDYVIRMRSDFFWNTSIPADIFENLDDNQIVLVYDNYCTHAKWEGNDKFFGGTSDMMDKYTDLYNHFEFFFKKNIRIEGQELARAMIKKLGLKIVFFGDENTYEKCAGSFCRKLERMKGKKK